MTFRAIATEIVRAGHDEKWQELRDRIATALEATAKAAKREMWHTAPDCRCHPGAYCLDPYSGAARPTPYSIQHWGDQPDGVR